jgi:hypothetical protein
MRFRTWTENRRVGGSIPPLATINSIFWIKELHRSAAARRPILALLSNIRSAVRYGGSPA